MTSNIIVISIYFQKRGKQQFFRFVEYYQKLSLKIYLFLGKIKQHLILSVIFATVGLEQKLISNTQKEIWKKANKIFAKNLALRILFLLLCFYFAGNGDTFIIQSFRNLQNLWKTLICSQIWQ